MKSSCTMLQNRRKINDSDCVQLHEIKCNDIECQCQRGCSFRHHIRSRQSSTHSPTNTTGRRRTAAITHSTHPKPQPGGGLTVSASSRRIQLSHLCTFECMTGGCSCWRVWSDASIVCICALGRNRCHCFWPCFLEYLCKTIG